MKDKLKGGLADKIPDSKFDPRAVRKGMKVEREHTSDPQIQKEVAKDHLSEDPKYYEKLHKMEKKAFWEGFTKQADAAGVFGGIIDALGIMGGMASAGLGGAILKDALRPATPAVKPPKQSIFSKVKPKHLMYALPPLGALAALNMPNPKKQKKTASASGATYHRWLATDDDIHDLQADSYPVGSTPPNLKGNVKITGDSKIESGMDAVGASQDYQSPVEAFRGY